MDKFSKKVRSRIMSKIRSKNTSPEMKLRGILFSKGFRGYRIHYGIFGKPDIAFPKKKIAIFIDGCFWHKCPKCFKKPASNQKFWLNKINKNIKRDKKVEKVLIKKGWLVIRIRECEIKEDLNSCYNKINMKFRCALSGETQ